LKDTASNIRIVYPTNISLNIKMLSVQQSKLELAYGKMEYVVSRKL